MRWPVTPAPQASYIKKASGWRALLCVRGRREERSFRTRAEATAWAERRAAELRAEAGGQAGQHKTLADAFARYASEVAPTHRGCTGEIKRLAVFAKDAALPTHKPLATLTARDIGKWRDARLRTLKPASVIRDMTLLGSVLTHCRREWGWIAASPMTDVRRPPQPPHRERIITWSETRAMLRTLGWEPRRRPTGMQALTGAAMLLALRTGMRAGELTGMQWEHVHGSWVRLPMTKNGSARDVPLSPKAQRLIEHLRGLDAERVLPLTTASLDALFRKARVRAGLAGFTFHDARHTAATRIGATVGQPGRLTFPEFCRVFGWRDPAHALIYVNTSAADLAARL